METPIIKIDKEYNPEIRIEVLHLATIVESAISELLIACLNVEKENLIAIGNKSMSISIKSKFLLLQDIEILNADEVKLLNELMEYRNKFAHLYDCNSFIKCSELLGKDPIKKQGLVRFCPDNATYDNLEAQLRHGYIYLAFRCSDIINEKVQEVIKVRERKRQNVQLLVDYSSASIEFRKLVIDQMSLSLDEASAKMDYSITNSSLFKGMRQIISENIESPLHSEQLDKIDKLFSSEYLNELADIKNRKK